MPDLREFEELEGDSLADSKGPALPADVVDPDIAVPSAEEAKQARRKEHRRDVAERVRTRAVSEEEGFGAKEFADEDTEANEEWMNWNNPALWGDFAAGDALDGGHCVEIIS